MIKRIIAILLIFNKYVNPKRSGKILETKLPIINSSPNTLEILDACNNFIPKKFVPVRY